jgi:hypothetical protein
MGYASGPDWLHVAITDLVRNVLTFNDPKNGSEGK